MRKHTLMVGLCLPLLSTLLNAQITPRDSKWEVSGFGGYSYATGHTALTPVVDEGTTFSVSQDFDHGWTAGIRLTEYLGKYVGGEIEYSMASQPASFVNVRPGMGRFDFAHRMHTVTYNGIFYPGGRAGSVQPYAAVGAGVTLFQVSDTSEMEAALLGVPLDDQLKFVANFGVGLRIPVGDRWGFRLDVRDYVSGIPDYDLPAESRVVGPDERSAGFSEDGIFHSLRATFGIVIALGRP